MKPAPYQQRYRRPWGLAGELCAAPANVEVADCTRDEVARFERYGRRAWWCILWLPVAALGPVGLAHLCHWLVPNIRFYGQVLGFVSVVPMLLAFVWFAGNVFKSASCPWCASRLPDQPRSPAAPHCSRCHQPLTLRAWDERVPRDSFGGTVPR